MKEEHHENLYGTGDRGKTSLFSGERVLKNSLRIEAYGSLDELNSVMGAIPAAMAEAPNALEKEIQTLQTELLKAGAWLATTPDSESIKRLKPFTQEPIKWVEKAIDQMRRKLPELRSFILPGGHLSATMAHMARTICRRMERRVIDLAKKKRMKANQTIHAKYPRLFKPAVRLFFCVGPIL